MKELIGLHQDYTLQYGQETNKHKLLHFIKDYRNNAKFLSQTCYYILIKMTLALNILKKQNRE